MKMLQTHFYSKCDATIEKQLLLIFNRWVSKILF